jgi:hypothetical protein
VDTWGALLYTGDGGRMKRTMAIWSFAAVAFVAGCGGPGSETVATPAVETETQADDVSIANCHASQGTITCDVTIVNAADHRLTYYLEATVETDDGDTVGHAKTVVPDIEAGQTVHDGIIGTFDGTHDRLRIRLVTVQRTRS